ncbi:MAG TPA: hypothetical protein VIA18_19775 [Polyangia bacterium]|jgi:hypothetical protein|nr:hypothetical protein [Polyangia bacterium]HWE27554.1 hypothetical protein [Polyangia bacterium]
MARRAHEGLRAVRAERRGDPSASPMQKSLTRSHFGDDMSDMSIRRILLPVDFSSAAEKVVRHCSCPVLTVHAAR